MEPACGGDWPRLTGKSSDIEGTGRDLWRLPERNAQPSYFAGASTIVCHRWATCRLFDRRSGQRFLCLHPDVVKRCVEPGLPSGYNTSPGERQPPPSPTRQARFPRQGERVRRQAIRVWISTGSSETTRPMHLPPIPTAVGVQRHGREAKLSYNGNLLAQNRP
jgi:hypothetical protein